MGSYRGTTTGAIKGDYIRDYYRQDIGAMKRDTRSFNYWVAVKEFNLSYYIVETILNTIGSHNGNFN